MARRKANITPRVRPSEALKVEKSVAPAVPHVEDPPEPEPEHFIGEMMSDRILNDVFSQPVIPDDIMQDNPFPGQQPERGDIQLAPPPALPPEPVPNVRQHPDGTGRDLGGDRDRRDHPVLAPLKQHADDSPHSGLLTQPLDQPSRYTQRITINDAYQFTGRVQTAPPWIDRNWLSYDDESSSICLAIPKIGTCLKGDYIVKQHVVLDDSGYSEERLAVYSREEFERLFMPVTGHTSAHVEGVLS